MENKYKNLDIYKYFKESELHSSKSNIYFDIYDELFQKYRGKKITFVEIGVKWGGSLLMWRKYFGKEARIIGIDLYPETKKWKNMDLKFLLEINHLKNFGTIFFPQLEN